MWNVAMNWVTNQTAIRTIRGIQYIVQVSFSPNSPSSNRLNLMCGYNVTILWSGMVVGFCVNVVRFPLVWIVLYFPDKIYLSYKMCFWKTYNIHNNIRLLSIHEFFQAWTRMKQATMLDLSLMCHMHGFLFFAKINLCTIWRRSNTIYEGA